MSSTRWPRKLWPLALFFRLLAGCATTSVEPQPTSAANIQGTENIQGNAVQFGQWTVGCSNLRICTTVAPVRDYSGDEGQAYIEIGVTDGIVAAQNLVIARNGRSIRSLSLFEGEALLDDLANGDGPDAALMDSRDARFDIPRQGFAEAMAAIEDWRAKPPQQLDSTDPVTPLPAFRIDNPVVPPTVRGIAKRCPEGHMGSAVQAWSLIGGSILWRASCGNEGLNSVNFWFVSGPQGAPPEMLDFADPTDPEEAFSKWSNDEKKDAGMLIFEPGPVRVEPYNSWFDERSGYLRMIHYFGHWQSFTEDCGVYRAYAFGTGRMTLVEKRYMPACSTGIGPEAWPVIYRAPVLNGPDSGP
jgi:hypothetical protein